MLVSKEGSEENGHSDSAKAQNSFLGEIFKVTSIPKDLAYNPVETDLICGKFL